MAEKHPSHVDIDFVQFGVEPEPSAVSHVDLSLTTFGGESNIARTVIASDDLEDVPELTEVVMLAPVLSVPGSGAGMARIKKRLPATALQDLGEALTQAVQARLRAEIPTLIEAALHAALPALTQEIRQGLESIAQDALRDFIRLHGGNENT
ncbi:MAG: hypothetical protein LBR88_09345 [Zoogloeaceae bacterium]|jgi:hypothetical protein|nr:hypothetical protein [Zoogloeaceae bacterium]